MRCIGGRPCERCILHGLSNCDAFFLELPSPPKNDHRLGKRKATALPQNPRSARSPKTQLQKRLRTERDQRKTQKKKKKKLLPSAAEPASEHASPDGESSASSQKWEEMLCRFKAHYQLQPSKPFPPELQQWVNAQRAVFKSNQMSREQFLELSSANFPFTTEAEAQWNKMFNQLKKHKQRTGSLDGLPESLQKWCDIQNQKRLASSIDKDCLQKLQMLGLFLSPAAT